MQTTNIVIYAAHLCKKGSHGKNYSQSQSSPSFAKNAFKNLNQSHLNSKNIKKSNRYITIMKR